MSPDSSAERSASAPWSLIEATAQASKVEVAEMAELNAAATSASVSDSEQPEQTRADDAAQADVWTWFGSFLAILTGMAWWHSHAKSIRGATGGRTGTPARLSRSH